jgi:hypothetical protein
LEGVKYDKDKPRLDLIPPELLLRMGEVLGHGASKYGERNWEAGMLWGRVYGATLRHLMAWASGEEKDPETGLPHLAHAATNIAFLLAYDERCLGTDDRAPYFKAPFA